MSPERKSKELFSLETLGADIQSAIDEVTLGDSIETNPNARNDFICVECGKRMVLRHSKKYDRPFYGCSGFPECTASFTAHKDGRPMGSPANKATKQARMRAHEMFDRIAKKGIMSRTQSYQWLGKVLNLFPEDAHIGHLNMEQCETLILKVRETFPVVITVWERMRSR